MVLVALVLTVKGALAITVGGTIAVNCGAKDYDNFTTPTEFMACTIGDSICGDGLIDGIEECDDGNLVNSDGCDFTCELENDCGNGVLEAGEYCDDGNDVDGDGCDFFCRNETWCGNGVLNSIEQCDDNNTISRDGCSDTCRNEGVFRCDVQTDASYMVSVRFRLVETLPAGGAGYDEYVSANLTSGNYTDGVWSYAVPVTASRIHLEEIEVQNSYGELCRSGLTNTDCLFNFTETRDIKGTCSDSCGWIVTSVPDPILFDVMITTWTPTINNPGCTQRRETSYYDYCTPLWVQTGVCDYTTATVNTPSFVDLRGCFAQTGLASDNVPPEVGTVSCSGSTWWAGDGNDIGSSSRQDRTKSLAYGSELVNITGIQDISAYEGWSPIVVDFNLNGLMDVLSFSNATHLVAYEISNGRISQRREYDFPVRLRQEPVLATGMDFNGASSRENSLVQTNNGHAIGFIMGTGSSYTANIYQYVRSSDSWVVKSQANMATYQIGTRALEKKMKCFAAGSGNPVCYFATENSGIGLVRYDGTSYMTPLDMSSYEASPSLSMVSAELNPVLLASGSNLQGVVVPGEQGTQGGVWGCSPTLTACSFKALTGIDNALEIVGIAGWRSATGTYYVVATTYDSGTSTGRYYAMRYDAATRSFTDIRIQDIAVPSGELTECVMAPSKTYCGSTSDDTVLIASSHSPFGVNGSTDMYVTYQCVELTQNTVYLRAQQRFKSTTNFFVDGFCGREALSSMENRDILSGNSEFVVASGQHLLVDGIATNVFSNMSFTSGTRTEFVDLNYDAVADIVQLRSYGSDTFARIFMGGTLSTVYGPLAISSLTCAYDPLKYTIDVRANRVMSDAPGLLFRLDVSKDGEEFDTLDWQSGYYFSVPVYQPGVYSATMTAKNADGQNVSATCSVSPTSTIASSDYTAGCRLDDDGEFDWTGPVNVHGWGLTSMNGPLLQDGATAKFIDPGTSIEYPLDCIAGQFAVSSRQRYVESNINTNEFVFQVMGVTSSGENVPIAMWRIFGERGETPKIWVSNGGTWEEVGNVPDDYFIVTATVDLNEQDVELAFGEDSRVVRMSNGRALKLTGIRLTSTVGKFDVDYVRSYGLYPLGEVPLSEEDRARSIANYQLQSCRERQSFSEICTGYNATFCVTVDGCMWDGNWNECKLDARQVAFYDSITRYCASLRAANLLEQEYCTITELQRAVNFKKSCFWEASNYCAAVTYPRMTDGRKVTAGEAATVCSGSLFGQATVDKIVGPIFKSGWKSLNAGGSATTGLVGLPLIGVFVIIIAIMLLYFTIFKNKEN